MSEKPIRAAVIGAGHLGRWHADKFAQLDGVELCAVVDVNAEAAETVAAQCSTGGSTRALTDYRPLLGAVDVVSIATPAVAHLPIARDCLLAGIDVLVEKPIATTVDEADELVRIAAERGRILQVGHLERFSPLMPDLQRELDEPRFLECHRITPFQRRGTDVDVLLDLMIHDIDLALYLVGRPVLSIEAAGAPVLSDHVDIANARLRFEGGCVANLTASRISLKSERKLRIFQRDAYLAADLHQRRLSIARRIKGADGQPEITRREQNYSGDPLREEIAAFVRSVRTREAPAVDGSAGREALAVALAAREAMLAAAG